MNLPSVSMKERGFEVADFKEEVFETAERCEEEKSTLKINLSRTGNWTPVDKCIVPKGSIK